MAREVLSLNSVLTRKAKILIGVIPAVVVFSFVVVIPEIVKSRCTSSRDACMENLKKIDGAKGSWALEAASDSTNSRSATNNQAR